MTLVSTVTVGSGGAATIEFTSIPQTGTDLLVVISGRGNASGVQQPIYMKFNSSGGTAYSERHLYGTGSTAASGSTSGNSEFRFVYMGGTTATASTFSNTQIYIPNYSGSTNKSISVESTMENNATAGWQDIDAGLWANTAAITSITLTPDAASFVQYSTASLYTITKGSGGATVS